MSGGGGRDRDRDARAPDPLRARDAAGPTLRLALLGVPVDVAPAGPRAKSVAEAAFGRFRRPAAAALPALRIELVDEAEPGNLEGAVGGAPAEPRAGRPALPRPPRHRERGGLSVATDGEGGLAAVDLAAGRAAVFLAAGSETRRARRELLEYVGFRYVTHLGMLALHAAAVEVGGRAWVLRGAGGAGKSTLAAAAALAGGTVLAEEVAWYDAVGGARPRLRGGADRLQLEPDALPRLGLGPNREPSERAASRAATPGARPGRTRPRDAKVEVAVARLGGRWREECAPGPIVFLEGHAAEGGPLRVARIDAREAAARFRATRIPGEWGQDPERLLDAVDTLASRGAYALRGGSPAERADWLLARGSRG